MNRGSIYIYTGEGRGKSPAALGRAIIAANEGQNVVIIQFLKGKSFAESLYLKRLEPEIKFFQFEKSDDFYSDLSSCRV